MIEASHFPGQQSQRIKTLGGYESTAIPVHYFPAVWDALPCDVLLWWVSAICVNLLCTRE